MGRRANTENDFWARVEIADPGDCWPWKSHRLSTGYGSFWFNGHNRIASRIAWTFTHGDPGDLLVCHRCDNPPCCNPAHLFLGTSSDNTNDAYAKGRLRWLAGSEHPTAILFEQMVVEMRERFARGERAAALADEFGISLTTLYGIVSGREWRHVGGPITSGKRDLPPKSHCKYGHALSGDNLVIRAPESTRPRRVCLTCERRRESARGPRRSVSV